MDAYLDGLTRPAKKRQAPRGPVMPRSEGPIDSAIWLLKKLGCFGAKERTRQMLRGGGTIRADAYWQSTLAILEGLDARQTRVRLLRHLEYRRGA